MSPLLVKEVITNLYKVTQWVLGGPENLFTHSFNKYFFEHWRMPSSILGIKIIFRQKSKLTESEICCKLLNEQCFFPSFMLLHCYFYNPSFDLLQYIFLIWLMHFIWDCSAVMHIPKCTKSLICCHDDGLVHVWLFIECCHYVTATGN